MKVIYTDQSIESLDEALDFAMEEQGYSIEKAAELSELLFNRADSLSINHYKGQYEENLEYLGEGHRRIVEGHFKIIYKVEEGAIYVTDFFDTRQDPTKMKG